MSNNLYIAIDAANALRSFEAGGASMQLAGLMAAAHGYREALLLAREGSPDARQKAPRLRRAAIEADREAAVLARCCGLTEQFRAGVAARALWAAWLPLFERSRSLPVAMTFIALAESERERRALQSGPQHATHGGTAEAIAAFNSRSLAEWEAKATAAQENRRAVSARLAAYGVGRLAWDHEMLTVAADTADALNRVLLQ